MLDNNPGPGSNDAAGSAAAASSRRLRRQRPYAVAKIAAQIGDDVRTLTITLGIGLAAFWAVLPQQQLTATVTAPRRDVAMLLPFAAIGLGVILLQALVFRDNVAGTVGWLVAVIAVGAGIIWHQSDPTRRGQLGFRGGSRDRVRPARRQGDAQSQ